MELNRGYKVFECLCACVPVCLYVVHFVCVCILHANFGMTCNKIHAFEAANIITVIYYHNCDLADEVGVCV